MRQYSGNFNCKKNLCTIVVGPILFENNGHRAGKLAPLEEGEYEGLPGKGHLVPGGGRPEKKGGRAAKWGGGGERGKVNGEPLRSETRRMVPSFREKSPDREEKSASKLSWGKKN